MDFDRDLTRERDAAEAMVRTMARRGPDDGGLWLARHVALGHRRLAVIDVHGGRQPMSADGLAVVTYSGEVYNFRELRAELEAKGHRFRTRSDTEVVLHAYLEWGEGFVDRLNGMSMAVGLEVRVPFCDHRLVEYVFNTPWALKTFDGREKSLLRAAVRDIVPDSILNRVKSPYPATQDPAYEQALRDELGRLADRPDAPVRALLDQDAVGQIVTAPAGKTTSTVSRFALEMVLDLNAWMATHGLRIDV